MVSLVTHGQLVNSGAITGLDEETVNQPIIFLRGNPMVLQGGYFEVPPPRPVAIEEDMPVGHMFWNPEFASYRPGNLTPRGLRQSDAARTPAMYAGGTTAQRLGQLVPQIGVNANRGNAMTPAASQIISQAYAPVPSTAQMVTNAR